MAVLWAATGVRHDRVVSLPQHRPLEPIPRWKIVVGVVAVGVLTTAAVVVLWWAGTSGLQGKDLVAERLDALKVGLSIGVGSGGLFALYLGWRRQRSTEADLDNRERALQHQQEVAAVTQARQELVDADARLDARERRITELYTKAADQLGSDKAAVRLAGLYALERLAQDNEPQRQTVVNVVCAYLRMPYTLPGELPADEAVDRERAQEREVRLAAQRILRLHLQRPEGDSWWQNIDIDLTGAVLVDFSFAHCHLRTGTFNHARFHGRANFDRLSISGGGRFRSASFRDIAGFSEARFGGFAWFRDVKFSDRALFHGARFDADTSFEGTEFHGDTDFAEAEFRSAAVFARIVFPAAALADGTVSPAVDFAGVRFADGVPPEVAGLLD